MSDEDELRTAKIVKHKKSGSVYDVLYRKVELKSKLPIDEGTILCVYMAEDGSIWARPQDEFLYVMEPVA